MRKERANRLILIGFLLILAGSVGFLRPFVVQCCDKIATLEFIYEIIVPTESPDGYSVTGSLSDIPWEGESDTLSETKSRADRYNIHICAEQDTYGFLYDNTYEDHEYDSLLAGPQGMLCVVEIPKIHVILPVGHGTSTRLLANYAGHLHGSSLPTGGPSTHAVIAAHAGLPDRELFTRLPEMKMGDKFNIYVLGEKHAYIVDQIIEVLPSETDSLLIIPGGDHVTLMTCVPYGINTHRLFVRGMRCPSIENDGTTDSALGNSSIDNDDMTDLEMRDPSIENDETTDLISDIKREVLRLRLRLVALCLVPVIEISFFMIFKRKGK